MSEETRERRGLITTGGVLLVVLSIAAWSSNPDEDDFKRWLGRQAATAAEGPLERLAHRVMPQVGLLATDWERTNYGFCSLVTLHDPGPVRFFGALGNWWVLDTQPVGSNTP